MRAGVRISGGSRNKQKGFLSACLLSSWKAPESVSSKKRKKKRKLHENRKAAGILRTLCAIFQRKNKTKGSTGEGGEKRRQTHLWLEYRQWLRLVQRGGKWKWCLSPFTNWYPVFGSQTTWNQWRKSFAVLKRLTHRSSRFLGAEILGISEGHGYVLQFCKSWEPIPRY